MSSLPSPSAHWVIILAAGQSSRLGHPKQLLPIYGQPLIRHMTQIALTTAPKGVLVVVPKQIPDIEFAIADLAAQRIVNPHSEQGMSASLDLAITQLSHYFHKTPTALDHPNQASVLIMGVDQVRLTKDHLHQLLQPQAVVVASQYHGVIGLPVVVHWSQLQDWQPKLSGDKGLRHLIRSLPSHAYKTMDLPMLAADIDTPEQYHYAQAQGWLDGKVGR